MKKYRLNFDKYLYEGDKNSIFMDFPELMNYGILLILLERNEIYGNLKKLSLVIDEHTIDLETIE